MNKGLKNFGKILTIIIAINISLGNGNEFPTFIKLNPTDTIKWKNAPPYYHKFDTTKLSIDSIWQQTHWTINNKDEVILLSELLGDYWIYSDSEIIVRLEEKIDEILLVLS